MEAIAIKGQKLKMGKGVNTVKPEVIGILSITVLAIAVLALTAK